MKLSSCRVSRRGFPCEVNTENVSLINSSDLRYQRKSTMVENAGDPKRHDQTTSSSIDLARTAPKSTSHCNRRVADMRSRL
jgi:hypothetical protein